MIIVSFAKKKYPEEVEKKRKTEEWHAITNCFFLLFFFPARNFDGLPVTPGTKLICKFHLLLPLPHGNVSLFIYI